VEVEESVFVVDDKGKKSKTTQKLPALDKERFDPERVPELIGTMKFKEIGTFLFAFRRRLCDETGASDVLFRKLGKMFVKDGENMLPNGLEDGGVLALITLLSSNMSYDEVLAVLKDFVASAYFDILPDPAEKTDDDLRAAADPDLEDGFSKFFAQQDKDKPPESGGGVEETKGDPEEDSGSNEVVSAMV
jgi:hypothetical protein